MRIIGTLLYSVFVAALVGVAGLLLVSLLPIAGMAQIKIVKSGSMEPTIPVGAVVVVWPATSYHVGDVITFGKDTKTQIPTTHRIVSTRTDGNTTFFSTKGDANEEQDPREVALSEVIGKVWVHVPYVGYVLDFARQPIGFALLVGTPAAMIILDETINIYREVVAMRRRRSKVALLPLEVPQKPHLFRDRIPTL